jgi:hypothetical protein
LFQTLDDKAECLGIFCDDRLIFDRDEFPSEISKTWKFASYLRGHDVDYASLYLEGKPLSEVMPQYLKDDWSDVSKQMRSFQRSLQIAQVDLNYTCFYDLVPPRFLVDYCRVKNQITEYVFANHPRPLRYEFYKHVSMLLEDISNRKVNLDQRKLRSYMAVSKLKSYITAMNNSPYVIYNQFGTKTGRLTNRKRTFPILTLPKSLREAILPSNDYFLEIDFNGAEVRTLLGLLGMEQPEEDVHAYHLEHVFGTTLTRNDAKVAFFAWLYGSSTAATAPSADRLNSFYPKHRVLADFYRDGNITTPYGRTIENVSEHHAINYLVQSTAAELFLKQALKVDCLLRSASAGSSVAFLIHDAIIIDMKKSDDSLIDAVCSLMSSTNFGKFKINISSGKTLGDLRPWIK